MDRVHHHVKEVCAPDRLGRLQGWAGRQRVAVLAVLCLLLMASWAWAAPFDREFTFPLPDGQSITLHGRGDDFSAVFETLDGYAVVFDPASRLYHYAIRGADGRLASSRRVAGVDDPAAAGLARHVRAEAAVASADRRQRVQRWESETGIRERWNTLKAAHRAMEAAQRSGDISAAPPTQTTVGAKVGLTMLVDFSDQAGSIPLSNVDSFLNGDNYTGYGNSGSVKAYFYDNSAGRLTYTNVVVGYIRVPKPKSYYDSPTGDPRELVTDAIAAMQALPNFTTAIRPLLDTLTVDTSNRAVACNIFYAGVCASPWSVGLWPHSWNLASPVALWSGGKKVYNYQMTDMGSSLTVGTFCHENGHMLCGFPDIYDYDYDSIGGAGDFCLMDAGAVGSFEKNPAQVCAYLKLAAGWATTVTDIPTASQTFTLPAAGSGNNVFLRHLNPAAPNTEYFVIENRRKAGRDALLPASGLAIWHVDELGNSDDQRIVPNSAHLNYEVSLEQADNLFHFQNNLNSGDARDLFYLGNTAAGYTNAFNDTTGPSAKWWSGMDSKLHVLNISASGASMTLTAFTGDGSTAPTIQFNSATYSVLRTGASATITITRTGDTSKTVSADYAASNGTAVAGTDYTTTSGIVSFAPGETAKTFTVSVFNPTHTPGDATVNLTLSNAKGGAVLGTPSTAVLTIVDTIPVLQFGTAAYSVNRDVGNATVTVTRQGIRTATVSIGYTTVDDTGIAGTDYTATVGTLNFVANEVSKTISIPINNAIYLPGDKTITVTLCNPTGGAVLGTQTTATLSIVDNQPPPMLMIADAATAEGNSGQTTFHFAVSLSKPSSLPVTVEYQTADDTATAGVDYTPTSGTLTIAPRQPNGTIAIPVTGESDYELDESFAVGLSNATGAVLGRTPALVTIRNDDPLPGLTLEDTAGTAPSITFTVRLSAASMLPVSAQYQTADGTALAGAHYTMTRGIVALAPGQTVATFTVPVLPTTMYEMDKKFRVSLTNVAGASLTRSLAMGTVQSSAGQPDLSIDDGSDMGPFVSFRVRLSTATELPVVIHYQTVDGTAAAGTNYEAASSILTILPGQSFTDIIVPIRKRAPENKTLILKADNVTNATLATSQATGVIQQASSETPNPAPPIPGCGQGAASATLLCTLWLAAMKWGRGSVVVRRRR